MTKFNDIDEFRIYSIWQKKPDSKGRIIQFILFT